MTTPITQHQHEECIFCFRGYGDHKWNGFLKLKDELWNKMNMPIVCERLSEYYNREIYDETEESQCTISPGKMYKQWLEHDKNHSLAAHLNLGPRPWSDEYIYARLQFLRLQSKNMQH